MQSNVLILQGIFHPFDHQNLNLIPLKKKNNVENAKVSTTKVNKSFGSPSTNDSREIFSAENAQGSFMSSQFGDDLEQGFSNYGPRTKSVQTI